MELLLYLAFALTLAGSLFVAFRYGAQDERQVALSLLAASIATPFAQMPSFGLMQHGIVLVDVILLILLSCIALRSDRYWPLFAAGFQLTTVFFHVGFGSGAHLVPDAYADTLVFWSYLVLAALILGTMLENTEREL